MESFSKVVILFFSLLFAFSSYAQVLINEVVVTPVQDWRTGNFYNTAPEGTPGIDDEWIELYITTSGVDLTGWIIELNDGTDVTGNLTNSGAFDVSNYSSLQGGSFTNTRAGDYLVLGNVDGASVMNQTITIILRNASSAIIDQVQIGSGGTVFTGGSTGTSDESIARIPSGEDSNVDADDFTKTRATLGTTNSPSGKVVINEVVTDPQQDWSTNDFDGTVEASTISTVDEWIELYIVDSGINLTGWTLTIEDPAPDFTDGFITTSGPFTAAVYFSFGGGSFINTVKGDYYVLGNATGDMTNSAKITLKDAYGTIIDQVQLGGGTGDAPSGNAGSTFDETVARYANASDSDADAVDFIQTLATLGTTNSPTGTVMINEIVTDPEQDWSSNDFDGTTSGGAISEVDEWVELYMGSTGINLTGWTLSIEDGSGDLMDQNLQAGGAFSISNYLGTGSFISTDAGDFLILGNVTGSGTAAMNNDVKLTLKDATGTIIDQVQLGGGVAQAPSGAATGASDESVARIPNASDTDADDTDFVKAAASIGASNAVASLPRMGNGLTFNGTTDYIDLGDNIEGLSTVTFETWVNYDGGIDTYNEICSKSLVNSLNIWNGGGDKVWFHAGTGSEWFDSGHIVSNASVPSGVWTHIAVTWNQATTTVEIYINGILDISALHTHSGGSVMGSSANLRGLGSYSPGSEHYQGELDEFRIWDVVRTQEEILENLFTTVDPSNANLLAYYRFDQSSGSSLPDLSSNNIDGTMINMDGDEWTAATWNAYSQNAAILQSGGTDVATGTSGELTLTNVSFLNDNNDLLLIGHENSDFSEMTSDLPTSTLVTNRYDRNWHVKKNDVVGTANGNVMLAFNLGATPKASYTYYLLERAGTSGDFSIVPVIGVNPSGNSIVFTLNASQIDNGLYYTMGRSDAGVGNALDFDGIDDHVVTMIDRSGLTDFTAETWYRFTGLTSDGYSPLFAGASDDFFIGKNTGNTDIGIQDNEWISNVGSGTDAWDGNWHHMAVSRSSGTNSLYLDGTLVGSGSYSGGTGIIWIGREDQGSPVHNFDGDMDEIRIWSDARTQQEILDNMYKNLAGDETNLVAYYRMNDGIGHGNTSLPDFSGNGNVGTLTNFDNLNTTTTASNYVTSTRGAVTNQNATLVNGGALTASSDELTISSTQTGGDFLQDANDFIQWSNDAADFTETATDVPAGSLISNRMTKTWNISKNDAIGTAHGKMTLSFDLEAVPNPDYTYYLLSRTGTSGDFSEVETIGSHPNGNSIQFTIDGAQVANGNYFTLGRSDAGAGNTLGFDGTDDYVSIADNTLLDLTNTATWEFWVQVDDVNAVYGVIDKRADFTTNNGYSMGFNYHGVGTGFTIQATSGGTSATNGGMTISQTHFSVNTWHHVAITYNKDATSNFEIYVDGISRPATSQTDIDAALYNSSVNLALGAVNGTGSTINGLIDEVRIWSDVRSKEEIQQNIFKSLDVANESNLVAYYKFNQGIAAGDNTSPAVDLLTDYSENNNPGTLTDFALSTITSNWVGSEATVVDAASAPALAGPGNALDFDGVDDYVDVSSPFNGFTNEITVEFWINATTIAAGSGVGQSTSDIGNAATDVFLIHGNTDGTMRFFVNSGSGLIQLGGNTGTNLENTGWHHIAAVANSSGSSIYVDGVLETSGAGIGTIQNNASSSIHIGKDVRYATARFLNGEIDEVRIWNTAQTADEIQNNMFEALDGNETGLVGYYKFDEPSGSATLLDQTANGNNGTLTNMDAATDWVSATAREPFKTLNAGNWNSPTTWKTNAIPNVSSAKLCISHDITLDADLSADMLFIKPGVTVSLASGQTLSMAGNVINSGSIVGDGILSFTSGTPMLSGTMSNITINGAAPALIGNTTISGTITLTDGIVSLGDYDMTIADTGSLIGGNSSSYFQTKNINTAGGGLVREVSNGAGQVPFPIGSNGTYTPLTMLNFGSTSSFDVRVFDGTYSAGTSGTAHGSTTEINKTWDVNALGSDFNTTITLQWNSDDQGASFDNTNMFISKNGSRGFWEVVAEGIVASGSGPFTATVSGLTSFSQIGGGSADSPLPVTLMYFTGENLDGINLLSWRTATERDNERFEIQRANRFLEFVSIGTVAGAGDSDQTLDYSFEDNLPLEGVNYYRLVQVDYDGTATNSKVIMIESEPINTNMTLYPNPFTDRINIRMNTPPSEPVEVSLYDLNGQLISAIIHQEPGQELTVIFNSIQKGIYFLKVNHNNQIHTERIIKGLFVVKK